MEVPPISMAEVDSTASSEQNKIKWEMNYVEASIFLQEGENNDKFNSHPKTREALPAYLLTHNHWFYSLDLSASLLLLALATVERPSIGIFQNVSTAVHSLLELCALCVLGISITLQLRWVGFKIFFSHKRSALKSSIWIVMLLEAFVVLVRRTSHFRITRCLRPMFLIDNRYLGGVRRFLRQILQSTLPILEVFLLLLFTLIMFTIMGFYFFSSNPDDPYFTKFEKGFVSLYVLLTTANYPDLMMPSYAKHRYSAAFFIAYIAITVYFLTNLMLAIVFTVFSSIEKEKFRKLLLHKREACRRAFKLLVTHNHPNKISFSHFEGVLNKFKKNINRKQTYLVFRQLNKSQTGFLTLKEFSDLYEVLEYKWFIVRANRPYFYNMISPLRSACQAVHNLVMSTWFSGFVYAIVACSGIVLLSNTIYISTSGDQPSSFIGKSWYLRGCIIFFVVEMTLKLIGFGFDEFFGNNWNTFDFVIVFLSVVGSLLQQFHSAFFLLAILTPLRILRLMQLRKRYKEIFEIFALLLPTILSAIIVIVIVYYFFAIIGMELFSMYDMKNCCINTTVEQFYKDDNTTVFVNYYYLNNFDNLFITGVTLFQLMVVNNWFIIMEGYASVSGESSRAYFMIFYLVTMVIMSLVMAFILEAFTFRMQYNETFKNTQTDEKVQIGVQSEELDFMYENVQSMTLLQELSELKTRQNGIRFEGCKATTKSVLQRRMFQNIIPDWIRQDETPDIRSMNIPETPHQRSFSALFPPSDRHPLVNESSLDVYPDEPIFPSSIMPENPAPRVV